MLFGLTVTVAGTLFLIATLHVMWAARIWWPLGQETALARAVVGSPGIVAMPGPAVCGLAALGIAAAGTVPIWPEGSWREWALLAAAAIFILRGLAAYVPAARRLSPEEPFATLDRRFYAPLCLILGIAFGVLWMV